jgi:hypothetical protein
MAYLSRQQLFKFACIVIACLATFAGIMMSMDLLQQTPHKGRNPTFWSGTNSHVKYQMEQDEACRECNSYHHSGEPSPFSKTLLMTCEVTLEQG